MSRPLAEPLPPRQPSGTPDRASATIAEDDLRLAAHLRTLGALAPGIAHDLRAPINAMRFNLEVLRESVQRHPEGGSPPRDARVLRYAEVLAEELQRLHERLEVLFSCLRPGEGRHEALTLPQVLHEIETVLVPTARKRQIRVRREIGEEALILTGDGARWRQALLHVATLALGRIAAGGELTLATREGLLEIRAAPLHSDPKDPTGSAGRLALARHLLEAEGGSLRQIDGSVSNEPGTIYAVEFSVSRNPHDVSGT